jgi:hypothetical protein
MLADRAFEFRMVAGHADQCGEVSARGRA